MKKNELEEGHFYKSRQKEAKWYVWIFVSFTDGNWIGKHGKDDNVAFINGVYFHDSGREYEEVSLNHPAFSGIGQFAIRNAFNEV